MSNSSSYHLMYAEQAILEVEDAQYFTLEVEDMQQTTLGSRPPTQ